MAVTTRFQGRTLDVPRTRVPCIDLQHLVGALDALAPPDRMVADLA